MTDYNYVCDWCGAKFKEKPESCTCDNLKLEHLNTIQEQIEQLLIDKDDPVQLQTIVNNVDLYRKNVKKVLRTMLSDGKIRTEPKFRYAPSSKLIEEND